MRKLCLLIFMSVAIGVSAQVGKYRNDMSIGVNGGYVLSNVGFTPKVNQTFHGGLTGGISFRYVCEKYFSTICAVQAEVNYAQIGWKEQILDVNDAPVINTVTGLPEEYSRTMNYIQIPIFAHLGWGREEKGFQFFFPSWAANRILLRRENKNKLQRKRRQLRRPCQLGSGTRHDGR